MAMSFGSSFMVFVATTLLVLGPNYFSVVYAEEACVAKMPGLMAECGMFIEKGTPVADPSPTCCAAVKNVDIPCICRNITNDIEIVLDMDSVFRVASFCGKALPPGTKCGSSIVP